jgi:hypothetical protein
MSKNHFPSYDRDAINEELRRLTDETRRSREEFRGMVERPRRRALPRRPPVPSSSRDSDQSPHE